MNDATEKTEKMLMNSREAASLLGISPRTLWSLTAPRGPIVPVRVMSLVKFSRASLEKFVQDQQSARPAI